MVKVKLALDHSNTSLVTVLLDREHREIKNLYSLRQSKEATITGKPSKVNTKKMILMLLVTHYCITSMNTG